MDSLTNQEFLYRQTPVNYDGTGTLTSIKGNTVSFNQMIGDFTNMGLQSGTTISKNADGSYHITGTGDGYHFCSYNVPSAPTDSDFVLRDNHKYYVKTTGITLSGLVFQLIAYRNNSNVYLVDIAKNSVNKSLIYTYHADANDQSFFTRFYTQSGFDGTTDVSFILCDLTLAYGSGNEPTLEKFENLFPLNVYDRQYSLIPFNGTGLKTTGKNLYNAENIVIQSNGITYDLNDDGSYTVSGTPTGYSYINSDCVVNSNMGVVTISGFNNATNMCCDVIRLYDSSNTVLLETGFNSTSPITINLSSYPNGTRLSVGIKRTSNNVAVSGKVYFQVEFGSTATAYEPYTSNTLSLPTLTYFPTGMKSAGNVYDELSDKAYTRVGSVDLGSLNWSYNTTNKWFSVGANDISPKPKPTSSNTEIANIQLSQFKTSSRDYMANNQSVDFLVAINTSGQILIRNLAYTDATAFKNSLSSQYSYFELATPTETDISLDLTYPVWNGGTEQILPINDSTPDTAPILCDIDYRTMIPVNATDDPDGSGTITGTGNYRYHSMATLTATPTDEIYRFLRWEDENGDTLSTNSTYSFTVGE